MFVTDSDTTTGLRNADGGRRVGALQLTFFAPTNKTLRRVLIFYIARGYYYYCFCIGAHTYHICSVFAV